MTTFMSDKTDCMVPLPKHLPNVTIRLYRPTDYDVAIRIIREIGESRLGRHLDLWDQVFQRCDGLMWAAMIDDSPVAFGGRLDYGDGLTCFHTDLVHPQYQRRGLGTLLCLTRFSSIDTDTIDVVGVYATEHSTPFYQRFGFELEAEPKLAVVEGYLVHRLSMNITSEMVSQVDSILDGCSAVHFEFGDPAEPSDQTFLD